MYIKYENLEFCSKTLEMLGQYFLVGKTLLYLLK